MALDPRPAGLTPMNQVIVFTLNGIVVYLLADWLVKEIERRRGAVLAQRQVWFFAIFLVLILVSFEVLGRLFRDGA